MSTVMNDKFAVFILSHGRPGRVITYNSLRRQGYTGSIYLIVDNEDRTIDEYKRRFGDAVIVFDKLATSQTFDTGDNFSDRRAVVFARNASFGIAKDLGLAYFLQLDDDYRFFWKFTPSLRYKEQAVKNLDRLFAAVLEYYKSIDALSVALAQNGDFIGGERSTSAATVKTKRKCMNTFFCSTKRPFTFVGRVNQDVKPYTNLGRRGFLMLTVMNAAIIQSQTQSGSGGMTDLYLNEGTYIKSFYTVMYAPSCTTVKGMGYRKPRLHHSVNWSNAVPCILDERWRKDTILTKGNG
jgi:hypothetical protein